MSTSQICILLTIVVYLVAMVLVGVYCSRKGGGDSSNEFYLGGRKLGPIVTAMSAEASDMSSYLLMGLPGLAYLSGVAEVGWTALGLAIGTYLNWLIVAKRLRRYTAKVGAITIPSFFSRRYQDQRNVLSCIAAVVILIFFIPYTASGFKAIGTLFNSLFGVDYHTTMIIGAAVVIGYTVLGGFLAVSTTDLIQSIIMTFALIFIVLFGIQQAGGWDLVASNASSLPGFLNMTQGYDAATGQASSYGGLSIVSTLAWGLGYFGMPHILLRFMAIEDDAKLKTSRRIATVWVVISMFIAILIGIVGLGVTQTGKIPFLGSSAEAETIIIRLSDLLSQHGVLFAIVAIFLAWDPNSTVFNIVSFAWAGFGASFGPLVLFSLFWKRTNKYGAISGMIAGGAMVFIWKYLIAPLGGAWGIYELLPAFLVGCIVIVVVSLATAPPSKEIVDTFESV